MRNGGRQEAAEASHTLRWCLPLLAPLHFLRVQHLPTQEPATLQRLLFPAPDLAGQLAEPLVLLLQQL
jgi:hypothetical protein